MAKRTIVVSDLSGDPIEPGQGATVTIDYSDARRGRIVLDVLADEVTDLARRGVQQKKRGRPKADAAESGGASTRGSKPQSAS